jgi:flagellar protein FlgJ
MIESLGKMSPDQLRSMATLSGGGLEKQAVNLKKEGNETKLKEFSQDFESLFIQGLLKEMRKSMPKDGLIPKSLSMEWFESMFDEKVANEISKGEGIGMSAVIFEQLTQTKNTDRPSANLGHEIAEKYKKIPVDGKPEYLRQGDKVDGK